MEKPVLSPGDLRALMARYRISINDVASYRDASRDSVSKAINADATGRPISQRFLRELLDIINHILLQREQKPCPKCSSAMSVSARKSAC